MERTPQIFYVWVQFQQNMLNHIRLSFCNSEGHVSKTNQIFEFKRCIALRKKKKTWSQRGLYCRKIIINGSPRCKIMPEYKPRLYVFFKNKPPRYVDDAKSNIVWVANKRNEIACIAKDDINKSGWSHRPGQEGRGHFIVLLRVKSLRVTVSNIVNCCTTRQQYKPIPHHEWKLRQTEVSRAFEPNPIPHQIARMPVSTSMG